MVIFLYQPRYVWGCFGFYTDPLMGKRIVQVAAVLSGLALFAALMSIFYPVGSGAWPQAIFLIFTAWVGIFGIMRLFWTGAMWISTQICESIAEAIPSLASAMYSLDRF